MPYNPFLHGSENIIHKLYCRYDVLRLMPIDLESLGSMRALPLLNNFLERGHRTYIEERQWLVCKL
jgi:hypothetical protein